MALEPITGKPVRFPPGRVEIRLDDKHRIAYQRLYGHYQSYLAGLPVLRSRDFDGRNVKVTPGELDALNRAFLAVDAPTGGGPTAFDAQEHGRTRLFKRTQYLS